MTEALDARAEILRRIRSALGKDGSLASAQQAWQAIPREYKLTGQLNPDQRMELFVDRLHDYGVHVTHCKTAEIAAAIAQRLLAGDKRTILVPPEIDRAWLSEAAKDIHFLTDETLTYDQLDDCDGVLTGCLIGIAETGTLGICHGSANGRRALTLIPDYHLCVIDANSVVETVPESFQALERYKDQPITLISGPSATADIEMTRIQGVHGPRVLDVLIAG